MTDDQFWLAIRQALLALLDAIERWREIKPRTARLRKWWKQVDVASKEYFENTD